VLEIDDTNFNVALRVKTSEPDLEADFRRYFRVVYLFEDLKYVD
jgi:hypothetical protein